MIDNLMEFLKVEYLLEIIRYQGEDDEGFHFVVMNKEKCFEEFRILKEVNSSKEHNIEKRSLGLSYWQHVGEMNLNKQLICS
ncbi:hypothetical protein [Bacillus thuringiensis]|uniref:hypothetical protein n=1 Tax=Bacillus thuringiensis TaxID=1428 RepID=UPI0021D683EA|nr:hypothetical protein [Bacillus thuringiensis]MCU7667179.1 hypothetical protein [Bacillus thuringiensis]